MCKRKVIFLDVDDTLIEWLQGFLKYLHEMNVVSSQFGDGPVRVTELSGYNMEESKIFRPLGKSLYVHMKAFIDSSEWDILPPLAYAHYLEALCNAGFELRVLSQVTANKDRTRRVLNMSRLFGNVFADMHFTCWRQKKEKFVYNFAMKNDCEVWMVDDKPATVKAVADIGSDRIHAIAICDQIRHAYLVDEYWSMRQQGVNFNWHESVNDFAIATISNKYEA